MFFTVFLLLSSIVQAAPLSFDFTATATSGVLNGATASGTFSFDSTSALPGDVNAVGLLTGLDFTWNGVPYTELTANTGWLSFDGSGSLSGFGFGNNCAAGSCSVSNHLGAEEWWASTASYCFAYSTTAPFWGSGDRIRIDGLESQRPQQRTRAQHSCFLSRRTCWSVGLGTKEI